MPELPDLEVVKERLQEVLPGQRIEEAEVLRPLVVRCLVPGDFAAALRGREFQSLRRRGKFLIVELVGGDKLVINPMLAGRLQYCAPDQSCATLMRSPWARSI
jgi:formamidopyrimidine-DNA glycosylase